MILDLLVSNDINEIEIEYIKKFNSVKNGYNMILDSRNSGKFKQSDKALSNFKKARSIKVVKLTLNGDFVEEFDSLSDASKSVNSQSTNISKCNYEAVKEKTLVGNLRLMNRQKLLVFVVRCQKLTN